VKEGHIYFNQSVPEFLKKKTKGKGGKRKKKRKKRKEESKMFKMTHFELLQKKG